MKNDVQLIHRILPLALLIVLLILCYRIVGFFISPLIWAAILAYVSWPAYRWLHTRVGGRSNLAALLMTVAISALIGIPLIIGIFMLQNEAWSLYQLIIHRIESGYLNVPEAIKDIPGVGGWIKDTLYNINRNPNDSLKAVQDWIQSHLLFSREVLDALTRNALKLGIACLGLFFFYRDGPSVLSQVRQASYLILGERVHGYFQAIGVTTQAVVYGIGLTAVFQGLLAGIGYWVAGAPNPVLLMLATMVVALIPFGTPFAWGGVVVYLITQGHTIEALGLLVWGVGVISWVDNLIRPLVISGATKIPFLIILIGVLGGLSAFGFIGVFVGPVVLAVAMAVWREWVARQNIDTDAGPELLAEGPVAPHSEALSDTKSS